MTSPVTAKVQDQYEDLPYPFRDPQDEKTRLFKPSRDFFEPINHYCFGGRQSFGGDFRVLVAGGGTGDATIFLAEQLRKSGGQVVHLDLSEASIAVAKERADLRQLENIEFKKGSILDVADMDYAPFDFIDCTGVLHHMEDPLAGLKALKSVLAKGGAMNIMVYAYYGRAAVYMVQDMMKVANRNAASKDEELHNLKSLLNSLHNKHWMVLSHKVHPILEMVEQNDNGLYDLFLHPQDRAYTVPQLYEWINDAGLNIVTSPGIGTPGAQDYKVERYIQDPAMLAKLQKLPLPDQQAVAEVLHGFIRRHEVYVTQEDNIAAFEDDDMVPYFIRSFPADHKQLAQKMKEFKGATWRHPIKLADRKGELVVDCTPTKIKLMENLDGQKTIRQLVNLAKGEGSNTEQELRELFDVFHDSSLMFLRHKDAKALPKFKETA